MDKNILKSKLLIEQHSITDVFNSPQQFHRVAGHCSTSSTREVSPLSIPENTHVFQTTLFDVVILIAANAHLRRVGEKLKRAQDETSSG